MKNKPTRIECEALKSLAFKLTVHGFRNSPIEDIHADGRISDEEMKNLNKTIVNQIYTLLYINLWQDKNNLPAHWYWNTGHENWDEPKLLEEWFKILK